MKNASASGPAVLTFDSGRHLLCTCRNPSCHLVFEPRRWPRPTNREFLNEYRTGMFIFDWQPSVSPHFSFWHLRFCSGPEGTLLLSFLQPVTLGPSLGIFNWGFVFLFWSFFLLSCARWLVDSGLPRHCYFLLSFIYSCCLTWLVFILGQPSRYCEKNCCLLWLLPKYFLDMVFKMDRKANWGYTAMLIWLLAPDTALSYPKPTELSTEPTGTTSFKTQYPPGNERLLIPETTGVSLFDVVDEARTNSMHSSTQPVLSVTFVEFHQRERHIWDLTV